MYSISFLPSTCAALVDFMTEQQINTEYTRFKDIVPVIPTNTPSKTPSKTTTRSEKKREVIKSALLHTISKDYIGRKTQFDEIQAIMKDIRAHNTTSSTKLKVMDASTNTQGSDVKNASTSVIDLPYQYKDVSTSVEDLATQTPDTPIPTNPPECPSSSSTVTEKNARPPPIGLPGTFFNPKKDILLGKSSHRTLFLTDSILRGINVNNFKTDNIEACIKKTMYYFTDFSNYEPEFGYSDKIIISAGINDLTRKRLTPEQICDVVLPQLRFSALYPNSKFIINSVLLTSDKRINRFIFDLNRYLIKGISELENVYFFNSHSLLDRLHSDKYIYTDRGIGIHIANYAVDYIRKHLVEFLRSRKISSFFYKRNKAISNFT